MISRLITRTFAWLAGMAAILFVSAGTLHWPAAWVFVGEMAIMGFGTGFWLVRYDPALLRERLSGIVQRGQEPSDRVLMITVAVMFFAWLVIMGLDGCRFRWSHMPLWLRVVGAIAILVSTYIIYLTFRENSYAAPVLRVQRERGQRVITTGPYRIVRHPMYAGSIPWLLGAPLLLGSWLGFAGAVIMIVVLCFRIGIEERMLAAGLEGYADYAARVRYRLIPGIW
jgi:protein-S-isoprenylcysteine O-methyltransferase Ste14